MLKKKVGYLGGTFDPIHFGHINLALEALEKALLDEIWFCPTFLSPHKVDIPPIDITHRLNMTQLAIEQEPAFKVILNESTEKKIFTYNTLLELQNDEANKNISFTLLLSEDLLEKLHTWHNIDLLINKFELFIASRKCHKKLDISSISKYHLSKIKGAICPIRTLEISSRDIRDRLKKKLCCTHLVPGKVLDYIYENELY